MVALLLSVMGANAKTKTTTLWKGTYTNNIEIPVANLVQGATITVSATVTASDKADDKKLRVFYCKNDDNWTQTSFTDISDWVELEAGEKSHSFTITEDAMNILNNNTKDTGSRGVMYIGANNKEYLTITKITQTETFEPTSESANLLSENWPSSTTKAKIFAPVSNAKIGDVLQFTVTTTDTWKWVQFKLTDKDGNVNQFTGDGSEPQGNNANTSFTLEFVISTVADLVKIMSDGFGVIETEGYNPFTLTAVKLLSYSDSHDAVEEVEMGSDGIMTYSNIYNLDFSDTGLTPYYTTSATTGKVTLTPAPDKKTWNYQGYILKGVARTYYPKVIGNNSGTYPNNNLLVGNTGEKSIAASAGGKFRYIFAKEGDDASSIGFYKLTSDHTLGANKAYLETTDNITPTESRVALVFDDGETTGIQELENSSIEELKNSGNEALKAYYNLNGQRVANPRKGLYVVNGKKVIIK